eukprot:60603-Karenia_brevis.AAC.1
MPSAVHVALDNKADVDYACFLLDSLRSGVVFDLAHDFHKKVNGDLWSIFVCLVLARGLHTVHVSKTKGHALDDHDFLAAHPHLRFQAVCNDRVDRTAKDALFRHYDPNLVKLSNLLAARHASYVEFVKGLHRSIFRVCNAAHILKGSDMFQALHPDVATASHVYYEPPPYSSDKPFV